jgi:hypothetical protein
MDEATIQKIAAEVVARLPFGDRYWVFLVVNVVVMTLVGALAALGTSYLRTRGQNLATKHDFDELREQLRANTELVETNTESVKTNTELVETIKAEVGQKDWATRERTNLRWIKLELLLEKMYDCDNYLDQHRHRFMDGKGMDPEQRDYLNELNAMGSLYFPELEDEIGRFYLGGKEQISLGLELVQALGSAGNDAAARESAYNTFKRKWKKRDKERLDARSALTAAARTLLVKIMDVEEKP